MRLLEEEFDHIQKDLQNAFQGERAEANNAVLEQAKLALRQIRYEAQQDVLNDISMFYNATRLHSYLGYLSPNQFESEMVKIKKVA